MVWTVDSDKILSVHWFWNYISLQLCNYSAHLVFKNNIGILRCFHTVWLPALNTSSITLLSPWAFSFVFKAICGECTANTKECGSPFLLKASRNVMYILSACSVSVREHVNKDTVLSKHTSSKVVHFCNLLWLCSYQQWTILEFTWTPFLGRPWYCTQVPNESNPGVHQKWES